MCSPTTVLCVGRCILGLASVEASLGAGREIRDMAQAPAERAVALAMRPESLSGWLCQPSLCPTPAPVPCARLHPLASTPTTCKKLEPERSEKQAHLTDRPRVFSFGPGARSVGGQ